MGFWPPLSHRLIAKKKKLSGLNFVSCSSFLSRFPSILFLVLILLPSVYLLCCTFLLLINFFVTLLHLMLLISVLFFFLFFNSNFILKSLYFFLITSLFYQAAVFSPLNLCLCSVRFNYWLLLAFVDGGLRTFDINSDNSAISVSSVFSNFYLLIVNQNISVNVHVNFMIVFLLLNNHMLQKLWIDSNENVDYVTMFCWFNYSWILLHDRYSI